MCKFLTCKWVFYILFFLVKFPLFFFFFIKMYFKNVLQYKYEISLLWTFKRKIAFTLLSIFTNDLVLFSATSQRTVWHEVLKDFSRSAQNVQLWLTFRLLWFLHLCLISHIHKVTKGREWHKMTQMFTPAEIDFK